MLCFFFILSTGYSGDRAFAVNFVLVSNLSTGATRGGWDIPEVTRCQYLLKTEMSSSANHFGILFYPADQVSAHTRRFH
jgi:hypothetical protein